MWLFAGITSISFKYSNYSDKKFKVIVTKLKQRSQSAGNFFNFISCTPTLLSLRRPDHPHVLKDKEKGQNYSCIKTTMVKVRLENR